GKPEILKYNLSGSWSRRLNGEHRIVYKITDDRVLVSSVKDHY
ncbi:MAG: Txe/YoeB family addiction module toxin, partial [Sphingobacteriaceae bacterium]